MGGNSSYNKTLNRVKGCKRTHREYHHRIDGHKILLQNRNDKQVKLPVNSNSESPIYLCGHKTGPDSVEIKSIGIYKDHKCVVQIDLEFDKKGNLIPYSKENKKSSHLHYFNTNSKSGEVSRKTHGKDNVYPIDSKYDSLIRKIVDYNKKHHNE